MSSRAFKRIPTTALVLWISLGVAVAGSSAFPADVDPRFRYAEMFELTRHVMTRKSARALLNETFEEQLLVNPELASKYGFVGTKIKGFTETQLMILLQEVPQIRAEIREYLREVPTDTDKATPTPVLEKLRESWRKKFKSMFADKPLLERFLRKNNPLEPFPMELPPGTDGYGRFQTYVTHPYKIGDVLHPADDAEKALIGFIDGARKEIRFNVFDFDLHSIADALIRARRRGLDVMGGIDKGVIEERPEVTAIFAKLTDAGIHVQAVDSVGLNHQKLIVADWSVAKMGRVAMSEGNFTKSCLSPGGDLSGIPAHSIYSVPNANMVNILGSDALAIVVHHELTKTIDPRFALRGEQYPISGAYEFQGRPIPGHGPRWMTIAFAPNGGLDDVNQNIIGRAILSVPGPVWISQFAASSPKVEQALFEHAVAEKAAGRKFVFRAVGDTPFAMQHWSIFLSMSGLSLDRTAKEKRYVKIPDSENKWLRLLGEREYAELLAGIRIAPAIYGTRSVATDGAAVPVSAKNHHKLYLFGEPPNQVGIFASFNSSVGAERNQEYIVVVADEELNAKQRGIVDYLSENSPRSVAEEATRRNIAREYFEDTGPEVEARKPGLKPGKTALNCSALLEPPRSAGP